MDLVALNVQRGRDHGLPPYVKWRQLCGLRSVKSWKMFASVVSSPEVSTFFLLHRKFKNMVINCNGGDKIWKHIKTQKTSYNVCIASFACF